MALNFVTAEEAANIVKNGSRVGFGGFTFCGCPKVVPIEIAKKAEAEHKKGNEFRIDVISGASTGDAIDGALSRAKAIKYRIPYQTNNDARKALNSLEFEFLDIHLSHLAQDLRYGFLGKIDIAIVEACEVTESGEIVLTASVGISPTICQMAKIVIVELNEYVPKSFRGFHDIYQPKDPPYREPINITKVRDRIGTDHIKVDPSKIYVVKSNKPGEGGGFAPVDDVTAKIGENTAKFFVDEIKSGRVPKEFLPVQSGVGNIANAVLEAMGNNSNIPQFEVYTEVIQDAVIDLMKKGRISFASGCSLTLSPNALDEFIRDVEHFKDKIVLRPQEISNNPEIARRLGVLAMNTAIEVDIFGNINSTHIGGNKLMNGIGGSGDFTRNSYISIFLTPSTNKGGAISCIVPSVVHADHSEHDVKIIISEYGIADLRGKSPIARAVEIIEKCAHPDYRPLLHKALNNGVKGHIPFDFYKCFEFHKALAETGSMINAKL